ncbi:MAG: hypothetical protein JO020_26055 [Chloroflexi bacterium]|nr:hypothetical protein [Chloroflexota bacterium]
MTVTVAQWLVRITGVLLLILGLLLWTGDVPLSLIPVHILLGVVLVLSLWLLAATASTQGVPMGMAVGVAILGLITLAFGLMQRDFLPGGAHWIIQGIHLLLGMLTVGSGEMIGGRLRRLQPSAA